MFRSKRFQSQGNGLLEPFDQIGDRTKKIDARLVLGRTPNPQYGDPLFFPNDPHYRQLAYQKRQANPCGSRWHGKRTPNKDFHKAIIVTRDLLVARLYDSFPHYRTQIDILFKKQAFRKKVDLLITRALSEYLQSIALSGLDDNSQGEWISVEEAFLRWIDADTEGGYSAEHGQRANIKNAYGPSKFDVHRVKDLYNYLVEVRSHSPQDIVAGVVLSKSEAVTAYRLLRKYKRQLEIPNVSFDKIISPYTQEAPQQAEDEEAEPEDKNVRELLAISQKQQLSIPTRRIQASDYEFVSKIRHLNNPQAQLKALFNETFLSVEKAIRKAMYFLERLRGKVKASDLVPVFYPLGDPSDLVFYLGNVNDFNEITENIIESIQYYIEQKGKFGMGVSHKGLAFIDLEREFIPAEGDKNLEQSIKTRKLSDKDSLSVHSLFGNYSDFPHTQYQGGSKISPIYVNRHKTYLAAEKQLLKTAEQILSALAPLILPLYVQLTTKYTSQYVDGRYQKVEFQERNAVFLSHQPIVPSKPLAALERYKEEHGTSHTFFDLVQDPVQVKHYAKAQLTAGEQKRELMGSFRDGDLFLAVRGELSGHSGIQSLRVIQVEKESADPQLILKAAKDLFARRAKELQGITEPVPKMAALFNMRSKVRSGLFSEYGVNYRDYQDLIRSGDATFTLKDDPSFVINFTREDAIIEEKEYNDLQFYSFGARSVFFWKRSNFYSGKTIKAEVDPQGLFSTEERNYLETNPVLRQVSKRIASFAEFSKKSNTLGCLKLFLFLHSLGIPFVLGESGKQEKSILKTAQETQRKAKEKAKNIKGE